MYIAAVYEVTLQPIDFYSSATVNHQCKSLSAGLWVRAFEWQYVWDHVSVCDLNDLVLPSV